MRLTIVSVAPLVLVFCSLLGPKVTAQVDEKAVIASVCSNINPTTDLDVDKEFKFESQFKVHVESVMPDRGLVANGWMEYSTAKKMMLTTLQAPKWDYALYHDYEHHQTLVYNMLAPSRGSCFVDPEMKERLGFYLVPNPPAAGTAPSVTDIFRITGPSGIGGRDIALQKVNNPGDFRSLKTARYFSCQKITVGDGAEAVVSVQHVVSNTKLARSEKGTVPVTIVFTGKYISGKDTKGNDLAGKELKHTYNFFHYATSVGDDDFQTPGGIVCSNRKGPSTFPDPPMYISFGQEVHDSYSSKVVTIKTVYDREFNFVAEEFFNPQPGTEDTYRFDDFYFGYSYTLNRKTRTCNPEEITKAAAKMNDYVVDKNGHIAIQTPDQFWDSKGIEYHYNGMKHFRGLETEVWIGENKASGTMYEWYFVYGVEHTINDEAISEKTKRHRIPYKRIFWPNKTDKFFSTYYFQVDFTEPLHVVDLSSCYENNRRDVALFVSDLKMDVVKKDETTVLRKAIRTLSMELGVHWTRISNPQIAFKGKKGYIIFTLLGVPKQSSDVVLLRKEPSLEDAYKTLEQKTKDRKLAFAVGNAVEYDKGLAFIEELKFEPPRRPGSGSGYSGGAMAGLCIAMAVIGLTAGGGGGYWFFIRHS